MLLSRRRGEAGMNNFSHVTGSRQIPLNSLNIFPTDYCNRRCSFCMLTGVLAGQADRQDMTLKDIDEVISFAKRSGINGIKILGGEPSCHPRIVEIIERIHAAGLHVPWFFTNGIFDRPQLLDVLARYRIGVVLNYFPARHYRRGQRSLVHANMRRLFQKRAEEKGRVGRTLYHHAESALSITFYEPGQDYRYVLRACREFGIRAVRFSTARCSLSRSNRHVPLAALKQSMPGLVRFVRDALAAGISTVSDCALVPCLFSKRDFYFFTRFVGSFEFTCRPILDIFPDLSVHYCMGMPIVSRLRDHRTAQEIFIEQLAVSDRFRRRPCSGACRGCQWRDQGICQGYCLQYKYDPADPADRAVLSGFRWCEDRAALKRGGSCR
jgi:organic radical activating enzyme